VNLWEIPEVTQILGSARSMTTKPVEEKIEVLSVELLNQNRPQVEALKQLAKSLGLEFGWHYLLDLTWILQRLGPVQGKRIMDAGAGTGVLQWYLADHGAEVLSVDRLSRSHLALRFRNRFKVRGLRSIDLMPAGKVFRSNFRGGASFSNIITRQTRDLVGVASIRRSPGKVTIYNQDLKNLADIADNSFDAIVAVSALEHNQPEGLSQVVTELLRVLKPGAPLLATLTAGYPEDWWHEPSSGWCYSDTSLKSLFQLDPATPSNYDNYDELMSEIANCVELREGLARFYFQNGNNGMPWGRWEPQYLPVGVCKIKPA